MATVHRRPEAVHSHPYRPELSLLRIHLAGHGYHAHATEAIVSHADREGTLEGCPELEPGDREGAELIFVEAMEAVPMTSHAWGSPTGDESMFLLLDDVWTPVDAVAPVPPEMDEDEDRELREAWEDEHDREMRRLEELRPIPTAAEPDPYEPTDEDLEEYSTWSASLELAPIAGGAPEADPWEGPDSPPIPGREARMDREAQRRWDAMIAETGAWYAEHDLAEFLADLDD